MIEFVEIKDTKHAGFAAALEIYADAFPSNERQQVELLTEKIDKGLSRLYVGYYGNGTIAAEIVKEAIVQIYQELYHRNMDYPVLNDFIHDIQDPIVLV